MIRRRVSTATVLAAALTAAAAGPATRPTSKPASPAEQVLPAVSFDQNALTDVVQFARETSGGQVFVDWGTLAAVGIDRDAPVTLKLTNVSVTKALAAALAKAADGKAKTDAAVVDDVIVLSTAKGLDRLTAVAKRHRDAKEPAALRKRLAEVRLASNALTDVVDFLRDTSGQKITVDWAALKAAGVNKDEAVSMNVKDTTLSQTLQLVLAAAGGGKRTPLDYSVKDGVVTISTDQTPTTRPK